MNNEIKVFSNEEFGNVRTVMVDNDVWFIGREIAEILGYGNGNKKSKSLSNAIADHVDEEDKMKLNFIECKKLFGVYQNGDPTFKINSNGMVIINESGLYSLILSSKLPSAKKFKRWVTNEVLPSIRKYGAYMTTETLHQMLSKPENIVTLLTNLKEEQEKNRELELKNNKLTEENTILIEENQQMKPKSIYCDKVLQSDGLITITQIAKDYGYSGKEFNKILHNLGIQYKQGNVWLLYSKYQNKGYTQSKTYVNEDINKSFINTQWTQKGRLFLYEFLKGENILPLIEKEDNEDNN